MPLFGLINAWISPPGGCVCVGRVWGVSEFRDRTEVLRGGQRLPHVAPNSLTFLGVVVGDLGRGYEH